MSEKPINNRVVYDPESGTSENPEANYEDVMVKAMEKLVKQVSDMEKLTQEMMSHIEKLTVKVNALEDVPRRLSDIEMNHINSAQRMEMMGHQLEMTSFDTHADEDLRDYMMEMK